MRSPGPVCDAELSSPSHCCTRPALRYEPGVRSDRGDLRRARMAVADSGLSGPTRNTQAGGRRWRIVPLADSGTRFLANR